MNYIGDIYRPPSEAYSFILQATVGCANNTCTFCKMYKNDRFYIKPLEEILEDVRTGGSAAPWRRVFIGDGDALVMRTDDLLAILAEIKRTMPYVERISAYATALDILRKSDEELRTLSEAGLAMLYIGAESGSKRILEKVDKRITAEETRAALIKAKKAGIRTSVTLISGLGGKELSQEHAISSARLLSGIPIDYIAYLTLYLEPGCPMYTDYVEGRFVPLTAEEALREIQLFLEEIDCDGAEFRANHASNYVPLAGRLNRDKRDLLETIERALARDTLRSEGMRGL